MHTDYRRYIEHIQQVRTSSIYVILAAFLFAAMIVDFKKISVLNIRQFISMFASSMIGGLYYAFYWARITPLAVIVGLVIGEVCAIVSTVTSYFVGPYVTAAAPLIICGGGFIIPAVVTAVTTKPLSEEETLDVWEKTRLIDDPLQPWAEAYSK
ncbi:hypothetical protein Aperf_G00000117975 [Anoplocephala perfoliata]